MLGLRREQIEAVLAYYAEFTEEIDAQVSANLVSQPRRPKPFGAASRTYRASHRGRHSGSIGECVSI